MTKHIGDIFQDLYFRFRLRSNIKGYKLKLNKQIAGLFPQQCSSGKQQKQKLVAINVQFPQG